MTPEGEERHSHVERERFWTHDIALGEGWFFNEPYAIRARIHTAKEQYHGRDDADILQLRWPSGTRDYVLMQPYILLPDITLTLGLHDSQTLSGGIGEIVASDWQEMRHQQIGNGQAWLYRPDKTLLLWECSLFDRLASDGSVADENTKVMWHGFEEYLVRHFPAAHRIVTPSWEPGSDPETWHEFLTELGYAPLSERAFGKAVRHA